MMSTTDRAKLGSIKEGDATRSRPASESKSWSAIDNPRPCPMHRLVELVPGPAGLKGELHVFTLTLFVGCAGRSS